jgi:pSer/pThr/pTyr-binding forkhead associated (FHA) protein
MAAKLLYRDAQGRDASVDVIPDGVFLGRGADCAVRTDDAMVSRKNCKISYAGGRWTVEDLGSSNGTFVNETRVQKQVLNHSDIIRCGTLQVRFVDTAAGGGSVQVDPALARTQAPDAARGGGSLDPGRLMGAQSQEIQALEAERDRLATRLRDTAQELELLHSKTENDGNELRKLRTEVVQLRERANEVSRKSSYRDDEVQANQRIAEELRHDMNELQADHQELKKRFEEVNEECGARGRLLERAQDDVQRFKQQTEELRNKLTELQRIKDEGWKELNNRVGEIEHLREVINEQERILEERRVALITFESTIKDMRQGKDQNVRDVNELKRERDEVREKFIRQKEELEVLQEEHRRLMRTMSDMDSGRGGGNAAQMSEEVRALKVENRKLESEKQRMEERLEAAERERDRLADTHANLDVDRAGTEEEKRELENRLQRAEEGRARAEMARNKAEEDKAEAVRARDQALQTAQTQRKKAEGLEEDLKNATTGRGGGTSLAEERARKLARELDKMRDELDAAKAAAIQAQPAGGNNVDLSKIKKKAEDAYYGINDAIAELRTNILLAKDLVAEHGRHVEPTAKDTLNEAIQVSADRADDAKGLLRALLEVIES